VVAEENGDRFPANRISDVSNAIAPARAANSDVSGAVAAECDGRREPVGVRVRDWRYRSRNRDAGQSQNRRGSGNARFRHSPYFFRWKGQNLCKLLAL
jgi:hypothetical protein